MIAALAIALAALALTPAAAAADEPVTSVSVTVDVGSAVHGDSAFEPRSPPALPQLTMRLAQRPLRRRRGVPVLRTGRTYRFAGRLTCAPEGTVVETGDGTTTVGADGPHRDPGRLPRRPHDRVQRARRGRPHRGPRCQLACRT